jgi:hypothetical protein
VDRRQPRIARAWAVTPLGFEVIEEGADQCCVEICDVQLARLLAGLFGGEAEQQPPGVAIRGDSAGTRVSLGYQTLRKNASSVGASALMAVLRGHPAASRLG